MQISFLNEQIVFLFHILQLLKTNHPWGGALGVCHSSWKRARVIRKAKGSRNSWQVLSIISAHQEWRLASEHPFWEGSVTRCTRKDSIWLQYSGGVGCIFEHNPKIWNNPSLVYSEMINLSSISKTCFMIHLSSPTTKTLCHILESNRAPSRWDLFKEQKQRGC